jgi:hypothetical protein
MFFVLVQTGAFLVTGLKSLAQRGIFAVTTGRPIETQNSAIFGKNAKEFDPFRGLFQKFVTM